MALLYKSFWGVILIACFRMGLEGVLQRLSLAGSSQFLNSCAPEAVNWSQVQSRRFCLRLIKSITALNMRQSSVGFLQNLGTISVYQVGEESPFNKVPPKLQQTVKTAKIRAPDWVRNHDSP